nr:MAG TPA: hypothetical protein [Caudoviricetes sp.]
MNPHNIPSPYLISIIFKSDINGKVSKRYQKDVDTQEGK